MGAFRDGGVSVSVPVEASTVPISPKRDCGWPDRSGSLRASGPGPRKPHVPAGLRRDGTRQTLRSGRAKEGSCRCGAAGIKAIVDGAGVRPRPRRLYKHHGRTNDRSILTRFLRKGVDPLARRSASFPRYAPMSATKALVGGSTRRRRAAARYLLRATPVQATTGTVPKTRVHDDPSAPLRSRQAGRSLWSAHRTRPAPPSLRPGPRLINGTTGKSRGLPGTLRPGSDERRALPLRGRPRPHPAANAIQQRTPRIPGHPVEPGPLPAPIRARTRAVRACTETMERSRFWPLVQSIGVGETASKAI